ncbi:MAG: LCCL domain-containing protein [Chitinophagaceae bacterium]
MKQLKISYPKILIPIALFVAVLSVNSQPSWSRGIQIMNFKHEEGMRRIKQALQAEGYAIQNEAGDFMAGYKNNNTAVIACNVSGDKAFINIFVASTSNDSNVPGAERVRLQAQMDKASNGGNNPVGTVQATWATQADSYRGKNGQRFSFYIPPGGPASGRLWGTDTYTDDSSIGLAAVHAGLISLQAGGTVTIEIREGLGAYVGSVRNGMSSNGYGGWGGSFVFVR